MNDNKSNTKQLSNRVINQVILVFALLCPMLLAGVYFRDSSTHLEFQFYFQGLLVIIIWGLAFFRNKIPLDIKVYTTLLTLLAVMINSFLYLGFLASAKFYIVLAPVLASYILSFRKSILLLIGFLFVYVVFGYFYVSGNRVVNVNAINHIVSAETWITETILIFLVSLCLLYVGKAYLKEILNNSSLIRKQNEVLNASKNQLQAVLDYSPIAIVQANMEGEIEYINNEFHKLFGYSLEEIPTLEDWVNKAYADPNMHHVAWERFNNAIKELDKPSKEIYQAEINVTCKDHSIKKVSLSAVNVSGKLLFTLNDFTQRFKIEQELLEHKENLETLVEERTIEIEEAKNKLKLSFEESLITSESLLDQRQQLETTLSNLKIAQDKLIQSEKMASLGTLTAGIAHEINNPINFVYAGINSLLNDFKDIEPVIMEISKIDPEKDDLKEKLRGIQQLKKKHYFDESFQAIPHIIEDIKIGANRTTEIIKGLRSFSRTDKDKMDSLNIRKCIETTLLLMKNQYKNNIEIVTDLSNEVPEIHCYPGKIDQVFLNLLSNAIDSISEKGNIWITTKKQDDNILISIKDNGVGISNEALDKLYDPFFTTKPVGKGMGLGLSITYGIIKEHNGTIKVKSEPNKGSEFILTLPIINLI
jgi:PAS domain S-box-containing protein